MALNLGLIAQAELPEFVDTLGIAFSHPSGFYDDNLFLSLSSPIEGSSIFYTLDGSNPQNSSTRILYNPLVDIVIDPSSNDHRTLTPAVVVRTSAFKEGFNPGKPSARSYIYLQNLKTQVHPGGSWPAYNMSDNNLQYFHYDMDQGVVNSAQYASQLDAALLDIPGMGYMSMQKGMDMNGKGNALLN